MPYFVPFEKERRVITSIFNQERGWPALTVKTAWS
jgi:hypothetical protein